MVCISHSKWMLNIANISPGPITEQQCAIKHSFSACPLCFCRGLAKLRLIASFTAVPKKVALSALHCFSSRVAIFLSHALLSVALLMLSFCREAPAMTTAPLSPVCCMPQVTVQAIPTWYRQIGTYRSAPTLLEAGSRFSALPVDSNGRRGIVAWSLRDPIRDLQSFPWPDSLQLSLTASLALPS